MGTKIAIWIVMAVGIYLLFYVRSLAADKRIEHVARTGRPVVACMVMANDQLLTGTVDEAPAIVIYANRGSDEALLDTLEHLATRIFQLYTMSGQQVRRCSEPEQVVARLIKRDRFVEDRRRRLPLEFTQGQVVYAADLMLRRQPPWVLGRDRFVPCLVTGVEEGQIIQLRSIDLQAKTLRDRILGSTEAPPRQSTARPLASEPTPEAVDTPLSPIDPGFTEQAATPVQPSVPASSAIDERAADISPEASVLPEPTASLASEQKERDVPKPEARPWSPVRPIAPRPAPVVTASAGKSARYGFKSSPWTVPLVVLCLLLAAYAVYSATQADSSAYTQEDLELLGLTDYAPAQETVSTLGELPPRRGRVLILHAPVPTIRSGLPPRRAKVAKQWASLSRDLRAEAQANLGTLISLLRVGQKKTLSVYDMRSKERVAQYELDGWPEFSFGEHGQIDIARFVELMPSR